MIPSSSSNSGFSHCPFVLFSGKVSDFEEDGNIVDGKILPYCSIDRKEKKSIGELEQEFLQALQVWPHKF